ncbi:hypothetical protein A3Q56_00262 [Intoshia linei]|uniref:Homeobox domain-containing protein n=1 Tax=Intoshia linei TaxID=1819745 RepID=A0A177BEG7_9BILA|nr:hypothetical protein A3Q56_00262 [Intoshia linei]
MEDVFKIKTFSNFSIDRILSDNFNSKSIMSNNVNSQDLNISALKNLNFEQYFNLINSLYSHVPNYSQLHNIQNLQLQNIQRGMKVNPYITAQYILNEYKTKPKRIYFRRAVFSESQRNGLEEIFKKQRYITRCERKLLAQKLDLNDSQIKIWFQNRRMKWRSKKEYKCENQSVNV